MMNRGPSRSLQMPPPPVGNPMPSTRRRATQDPWPPPGIGPGAAAGAPGQPDVRCQYGSGRRGYASGLGAGPSCAEPPAATPEKGGRGVDASRALPSALERKGPRHCSPSRALPMRARCCFAAPTPRHRPARCERGAPPRERAPSPQARDKCRLGRSYPTGCSSSPSAACRSSRSL
jgi:hypothetical protein